MRKPQKEEKRQSYRQVLQFCSSVKNSKLAFIKVAHKSTNGKDIKEDTPKRTVREGSKTCLQKETVTNTLIKRYELFNTNPDNKTKVELAFENMSRSSSNEP